MPMNIKCKLLFYADNSALLISGKDPQSIVDNKLSLHLGKAESILFSTKKKNILNNNYQVYCNTTPIKQVNNVEYLGLTFDNTLSGHSITSNIIKKSKF